MDTKTYNVALKAKRTSFGEVSLNLSKNGKILGGINKPLNAEMALVLTQQNHVLESIYGDNFVNFTSIPDELVLSPEMTDVNDIFNDGENLKTIDTHLFDTKNITEMGMTFCGCSSLETLDLSHWCVDNVETMYMTFYGCSNLKTLDITGWNTAKCNSFNATFCGCYNLEEIKGILDITGDGDYPNIFNEASNLKSMKIRARDIQKKYFFKNNPIPKEAVKFVD